MRMRFVSLSDGEGRWGTWDAAVRGWRARGLDELAAKKLATDLDIQYDQYGPRPPEDLRRRRPAMPVDRATWAYAGRLDCWIRERDGTWWGRVTTDAGESRWVRSTELRPNDAPDSAAQPDSTRTQSDPMDGNVNDVLGTTRR